MRQRVRWALAAVPVLVFMMLNLSTQAFYTHRSLALAGDSSAAFVEVPQGSELNLDRTFAELRASTGPESHVVVSDSTSVVLTKLYAKDLTSDTFSSPSYDFLGRIGVYEPDKNLQFLRIQSIDREARRLSLARKAHFRYKAFLFETLGRRPQPMNATFLTDDYESSMAAPRAYFITGQQESVLNRFDEAAAAAFGVRQRSGVPNHLIFINSSIGQTYAFGEEPESFFQLEPDYFYGDRTMAAVGRYLLCRVENATQKVRLVFWVSTSIRGDKSSLPPISVIGRTRVTTNVTGRGSARIVSEPVSPQIIDGAAYVLIDMGVRATPFRPRDYGVLFNLYHREVQLDPRKLTTFVRDISAIDEDEYRALPADSALEPDAGDLLRRSVLYSGIYEDGWISQSASVRLHSTSDDDEIHVQGSVPLTNDPSFTTDLTVFVDGQALATRSVGLGEFNLHVSVPAGEADRTVSVSADRTQTLPNGDGRTVAAELRRVAFESSSEIVNTDAGISLNSGWYNLEHSAGATFRWFSNDAKLAIFSGDNRRATVTIDAAGGPGLYHGVGRLTVSDDRGRVVYGGGLAERTTFTFLVALHPGRNVLTLAIDGGGKAISSDSRLLNARVFSVKAI